MDIQEILQEINNRTKWGSNNYYKPLDKEASDTIRAYYAKRLLLDLEGNDKQKFFNHSGTLLAIGYTRVVIGDYGAYVEFAPEQIQHENIEDRFERGKAKPYQKYWWMLSKDESKTKVYEQIRGVKYADYVSGMYYIAPDDLSVEK